MKIKYVAQTKSPKQKFWSKTKWNFWWMSELQNTYISQIKYINSHKVQVLGMRSAWLEDYVQACNAMDKQPWSYSKIWELDHNNSEMSVKSRELYLKIISS